MRRLGPPGFEDAYMSTASMWGMLTTVMSRSMGRSRERAEASTTRISPMATGAAVGGAHGRAERGHTTRERRWFRGGGLPGPGLRPSSRPRVRLRRGAPSPRRPHASHPWQDAPSHPCGQLRGGGHRPASTACSEGTPLVRLPEANQSDEPTDTHDTCPTLMALLRSTHARDRAGRGRTSTAPAETSLETPASCRPPATGLASSR